MFRITLQPFYCHNYLVNFFLNARVHITCTLFLFRLKENRKCRPVLVQYVSQVSSVKVWSAVLECSGVSAKAPSIDWMTVNIGEGVDGSDFGLI